MFILDVGIKSIHVIYDDTDVFVLLVFFIRNWVYKPMFSCKKPVVSGA